MELVVIKTDKERNFIKVAEIIIQKNGRVRHGKIYEGRQDCNCDGFYSDDFNFFYVKNEKGKCLNDRKLKSKIFEMFLDSKKTKIFDSEDEDLKERYEFTELIKTIKAVKDETGLSINEIVMFLNNLRKAWRYKNEGKINKLHQIAI